MGTVFLICAVMAVLTFAPEIGEKVKAAIRKAVDAWKP